MAQQGRRGGVISQGDEEVVDSKGTQPALRAVPVEEDAGELPLFPLDEYPRARPGAVSYLKVGLIFDLEAPDDEIAWQSERLDPLADESTIFEKWGGGYFRIRARDASHRTIAEIRKHRVAGAPRAFAGTQSTATAPAAAVAPPPAPVQMVAPGVLATHNLDPLTQALITQAQQSNERFREEFQASLQRMREESDRREATLLKVFELSAKQAPVAPIDPTGVTETLRETRKAMQELSEENMKLRRQAAGVSREKKEPESEEDLMSYAGRKLVDGLIPHVAKELGPDVVPIARKFLQQATGGGGDEGGGDAS